MGNRKGKLKARKNNKSSAKPPRNRFCPGAQSGAGGAEDPSYKQEFLQAKAEAVSLLHTKNEYEKIVQDLTTKVSASDDRVRELEQQLKHVRELEEEHARVCEEHRKQLEEQQKRLVEMDQRRQAAVDELYNATGKIYVYVRARPMLPKEAQEGRALTFPTPNTVGFASGRNHEHTYNVVWDERATQVTVFKELQRFVQDVLDGISCCIFAYGQTGSGKTYTLYGRQDDGRGTPAPDAPALLDAGRADNGIIPRALQCVFDSVATLREAGWRYTFAMTFVEVYNEQLHDLLDLDAKPVLRTDQSGVPKLHGVSAVVVGSAAEAFGQLRRAAQNRTIAATSFNAQSSRSHVLFRLSVVGTNESGTQRVADLDIVDLAGSEKYDCGAAAVRLAETANINLSLLSLMNVISALAHRRSFVSFRDSVLTRVLQSSLGGRSKVAVIVNVSPCTKDEEETINSLRFADDTNGCFLKAANAASGSSSSSTASAKGTKPSQPAKKAAAPTSSAATTAVAAAKPKPKTVSAPAAPAAAVKRPAPVQAEKKVAPPAKKSVQSESAAKGVTKKPAVAPVSASAGAKSSEKKTTPATQPAKEAPKKAVTAAAPVAAKKTVTAKPSTVASAKPLVPKKGAEDKKAETKPVAPRDAAAGKAALVHKKAAAAPVKSTAKPLVKAPAATKSGEKAPATKEKTKGTSGEAADAKKTAKK